MSLAGLKRTALALLPSAEPLRGSGEARVTGMPFRLDIVETGKRWVVTCTTAREGSQPDSCPLQY